jgi:hypothetical protein
MKRRVTFGLALALMFFSVSAGLTDYTLLLKNGRRMTVQNYREEGSMIKIQGLGGEFGIAKDQIQSILKAAKPEQQGSTISGLGASTESSKNSETSRTTPQDNSANSEQTKTAVTTNEEQEYQQRLNELTRKLETARQNYFLATQGGSTSSAATKEGYRALTADLMSRLKDRRGASESEYEPQEKELRSLRLEINSLQKERDALIQEMKAKNLSVGVP